MSRMRRSIERAKHYLRITPNTFRCPVPVPHHEMKRNETKRNRIRRLRNFVEQERKKCFLGKWKRIDDCLYSRQISDDGLIVVWLGWPTDKSFHFNSPLLINYYNVSISWQSKQNFFAISHLKRFLQINVHLNRL